MSQEASLPDPAHPETSQEQALASPEIITPPQLTVAAIGATALGQESRRRGLFRRSRNENSQNQREISLPAHTINRFDYIIGIAEKRIAAGYAQEHGHGMHALEVALRTVMPSYTPSRERQKQEATARKHLGANYRYTPTGEDIRGDALLAPYKERIDAARDTLKPIKLSDVQSVRDARQVAESGDLAARNIYTEKATELASKFETLAQAGYFNTAVVLPPEGSPTAPVIQNSTPKGIANIEKILGKPAKAVTNEEPVGIDPQEMQRRLAERRLQRETERDAREEEKARWEREDHERRRTRRQQNTQEDSQDTEPHHKPETRETQKHPQSNTGALSREYYQLYRAKYKDRGENGTLADGEALAIRTEALHTVAARHFNTTVDNLTDKQVDEVEQMIASARESYEKSLLSRIKAAKKIGVLDDENIPMLLNEISTNDLARAGEMKKSINDMDESVMNDNERSIKVHMDTHQGRLPEDVWRPIRDGVRFDVARSHLEKIGKGDLVADKDAMRTLLDALNAAHLHKVEFEFED